eukprot:TRINITY_DN1175_c0_g1_i1.p1 TRINITY_DN1175_c0_g1~~TRINITY_DN1175_c0_g1_i1.p1  ORF type:complete len:293 (+),score=48.89 TRINITY_DN1175_c0_g1_i1:266-1144(+)
MNPGGSVKDRAAWGIVKDAEDSGKLKAGGTVVEGTAGNTGIGLAHVCKARGYKLVIYIPNNQTPTKILNLRSLGAEVYPVPVVPFTDPNNFNHLARKHAENEPNAVWGNQFDNVANKKIHMETTGPEIWCQTKGKIDAWTVATGTGGTYAGVATYLKSKNPDIKCFVADPSGSVLYNFITKGELVREGAGSITEGIGQGRLTENMKGAPWDGALHVPDDRIVQMVFELLSTEGIFVGASSALNIVAAYDLALKLGPGHTIVTVLCDSGHLYKERLFNPEWLESKGLLQFATF